MEPNDKTSKDDLLNKVAKVVPILNGKDSEGKNIHLGPKMLRIERYLLVLLVAKSRQMFSLEQGEEFDGSLYFTLYGLAQIADNFKRFKPFRQPIHLTGLKLLAKYMI